MFDWLSKADPAFVLTALGAGVTWIIAKARGQSTKSLEDQIRDEVMSAVFRLLRDNIHDDAKVDTALRWAADTLLDKIGLERTKSVDRIVERVIAKAKLELLERIWDAMPSPPKDPGKTFEDAERRGRENPIGGGYLVPADPADDEPTNPRGEVLSGPSPGTLEVLGGGSEIAAAKVRVAIAKAPPER